MQWPVLFVHFGVLRNNIMLFEFGLEVDAEKVI